MYVHVRTYALPTPAHITSHFGFSYIFLYLSDTYVCNIYIESSQAKLPISGFPTLLPEQNKNYLVTLKREGLPQLHSNVTREFLF